MFEKQLIKNAFEHNDLVILKGLPATGKSTDVLEFLSANRKKFEHLKISFSQIGLRDILYKKKRLFRSDEEFLLKLAKSFRNNKHPIVFIDRINNLNSASIAKLINYISRVENIKIIITIDSSWHLCEETIKNMPSYFARSILEKTALDVNKYIRDNSNKLLQDVDTSNFTDKEVSHYLSFCNDFSTLNDFKNVVRQRSVHNVKLDYTLSDFMKEVVITKFESLPTKTQEALKTSSVLGETFNINHLKDNIKLKKIDEILNYLIDCRVLRKVEGGPSDSLSFEPSIARYLIYSTMEDDEKNELNKIIGDYFYNQYEGKCTIDSALTKLPQAISFYKELTSKKYREEILPKYFLYIKMCFKYNMLDDIVSHAICCLNMCEDKSMKRFFAIKILYLCEKKSLWSEAKEIYSSIISTLCMLSPQESAYIAFIKACCDFNTNNEMDALTQFESLYKVVGDDFLNFKIANWLYSIYYDTGDIANRNKYFKLTTTAMNKLTTKGIFIYQHEKYNFVRKIGMHKASPIVIKNLQKAISFFTKSGLNIDAGKCEHNLGIAYMCNRQYQEAFSEFTRAIKHFGLTSNSVYPEIGLAAIDCLKDGKWSIAKDKFLAALKKYSIDNFIKIELYFNVASCCYKNAEWNEAKKYLNLAKELVDVSSNNNYNSYFYQQFEDIYYIMEDIEKNIYNIEKMKDFKPKDMQYKQLIDTLISRAQNTPSPYAEYVDKFLIDVLDKNIFPHFLLFWE